MRRDIIEATMDSIMAILEEYPTNEALSIIMTILQTYCFEHNIELQCAIDAMQFTDRFVKDLLKGGDTN